MVVSICPPHLLNETNLQWDDGKLSMCENKEFDFFTATSLPA